MDSKTLILIRHAHRDTDDRTRDNGLSDKGREQVRKMIKFAEKRLEGTSPIFFTSPKKRCVETISPLAKEYQQMVHVEPRLSEYESRESTEQYLARLNSFLEFWMDECPEVTVVCSHGDWIPVAIQKLTGATVALKKSGWCEIENIAGENYLSWLVQKY